MPTGHPDSKDNEIITSWQVNYLRQKAINAKKNLPGQQLVRDAELERGRQPLSAFEKGTWVPVSASVSDDMVKALKLPKSADKYELVDTGKVLKTRQGKPAYWSVVSPEEGLAGVWDVWWGKANGETGAMVPVEARIVEIVDKDTRLVERVGLVTGDPVAGKYKLVTIGNDKNPTRVYDVQRTGYTFYNTYREAQDHYHAWLQALIDFGKQAFTITLGASLQAMSLARQGMPAPAQCGRGKDGPVPDKPKSCFPAGTSVLTSDGLRPIESVRPDDKVWAHDLVTGAWRLCRVTRPYSLPYKGMSVFITVASETIESTYRHPYWVVRGEDLASRPWLEHLAFIPENATTKGRWVDSCDVRVGDRVLLRDGRIEAVERIVLHPFEGTVYNMQVEELECYAVGQNSVLVHNNNSPETGPTSGNGSNSGGGGSSGSGTGGGATPRPNVDLGPIPRNRTQLNRPDPNWGHAWQEHGQQRDAAWHRSRAASKVGNNPDGTPKWTDPQTNPQQGYWTNNKQAAEHIGKQNLNVGHNEVPIPDGMGKVVFPDGTESKAKVARVIVNPDGTINTAYPIVPK